jgi:hypothetical protein
LWAQRKKRTHNRGKKKAEVEGEAELVKVPKTFVLRKGESGKSLKLLVNDIRMIMLPNTAERLKVSESL